MIGWEAKKKRERPSIEWKEIRMNGNKEIKKKEIDERGIFNNS